MSIQLRVRTEYSFGRTFAKLQRVVDRLKEMGVTAAAVVDNNTWSHVPWFEACTKAGIQPMLGVECIVNDDEDRTTMWFIAATTHGLSELYRAISNAHRQPVSGRSGKAPRLYRADVEAMSDQIIKFAGDITDGEWLKSIGAFVDLSPASRLLNATKQKIAERWGLECVRTGDNAYAVPSDLPLLQIVAGGAEKTTPQHLIPIEPDPVHDRIAEMTKGLQLPKAPMVRTPGDLEALCREGISKRGWTAESWPADYEERLKYELDLIRSKDFDSYFLVVADMCRYAKANMLVGPSRGSAAGSLVCYLAGITEIDPMPPKLYFERFIDVTRTDLPDIDLDFPGIKRHMVFEYMAEKYGAANTAHIGTVGRFKPKSALIEVCKALNIPPAATAAVKMNIIERGIADSRASNCLEDTFKETDAGRQFAAMYPQALVAGEIEGHSSHTGVHAAGLLVCNEPITNFCVVDAEGIAHVEKGPAEKLGLLKIDVLGLRTLDVLEDCGVPIDWYALKPEDPAVFEIFNKQQFCGIFQFEGNAMRSLSTRIHFETVKEIDAVTALARPGPFSSGVTEKYIKRHNGEKWEPVHPQVDALMQDAYGLPLYQEHTLAIVRDIGKFGWNETSFVRKAISKRQGTEFFQKFFPPFLEGALSQGIPEAAARATWESINAMGAWQMNKAHTYSYAMISYWTAYLKRHHPLEFAAATLRNAKDDESALELLREMSLEGIEMVPFDLQHSQVNWSVHNGKLLGGFLNLHGFGAVNSAKIVAARDAGTLTPKQLEKIQKAENKFADIFPFHNRYRDLYENPGKHNINGEVWDICRFDGTQRGSHVFLGEIIYKNNRNYNEAVNVAKRGGKVGTGPLDFLDLRVRDDTGMIGVRFGRFDYERLGRHFAERVPVGAHVMIRADFIKDIRFGFIQNAKVLT